MEIGHEISFLPSADSVMGSCQLLTKECALSTCKHCIGGLPRNSVERDWLTDRARNNLKNVEGPLNTKTTTTTNEFTSRQFVKLLKTLAHFVMSNLPLT